ncbi:uncharacterized protein LOC128884265 [Hylaeus volcanicus]|uniref:uncharacterized protein LOC128884265 n=1 Tax=Hylaeus volcanicus TaxID=313075 RepID=UPI0023B815CF|nr:uncharacterized protein LOC128884265 [Hylaeus volcanicus]
MVETNDNLVIYTVKDYKEKEYDELLRDMGEKVRQGYLVVFPTETVYGLGSNALSSDAVSRIFKAKKRPMCDPVICHVKDVDQAFTLFSKDQHELILKVLRILAEEFWPGPLSLVAAASDIVPPEVMGGSGFVSARCPNHPVALDFIRSANVPIAGPSANQFGHISPSLAQHVAKDFKNVHLSDQCQHFCQEKLYLLDAGPCRVGIESTVCKVALSSDGSNLLELSILRRGFISLNDIKAVLQKHCEQFKTFRQGQYYHMFQNAKFNVIDRLEPFKNEGAGVEEANKNMIQPLISPGNLLSHYAPLYSTFLLSRCKKSSANYKISIGNESSVKALLNLSNCILVDSFQKFADISHLFGKYLSLYDGPRNSSKKESDTMQQNLFYQLHLAEDSVSNLQNCSSESFFICITDFYEEACLFGEGVLAVYDRVFRSASGKKATLVPYV